MALPDHTPSAPPDRLDSWKEIGAYLNRGLSTVQRWEHEEGLPVHRLHHGKGGSVFASRCELDAWWASRGARLAGEEEAAAEANRGHEQGATPSVPAHEVRFATTRTKLLGVVLGLIAIVALASSLRSVPTPSATPRAKVSQRLTLPLPPDAPLAPVSAMPLAGDKPALAISPDGRVLVYSAERARRLQLVAYDMVSEMATPLTGSEEGHTPFFSPDGTKLGFFARGKLWTMAVAGGGSPTASADASNGWGAAWGGDGAIYFTPVENAGVLKVDPAVGRVETVIPNAGAVMPQPLQAGRGLLTYIALHTGVFRNGAVERLLFKGFSARYVESGHLVYGLPGELMAAPFDLDQAVATGAPVALAGDLRTGPYGVAQFTVASDGTLIYVPGRDQSLAHFVRIDREGRRHRLDIGEARYGGFSVTTDGKRLAVQIEANTAGTDAGILVFDLAGNSREIRAGSPLPRAEGARQTFMKWDPNGQHLVYAMQTSSGASLVWARPDGTERRVLWQSTEEGLRWLYPMSFSLGGRLLAAFGPSPATGLDLYVLPIRDADGTIREHVEPVLFIGTPALESFPQFSPDGTAVAYASDASGQYEVYVAAYPTPGSPCQVTREGAMDPTWTAGGREIVYKYGTALHARAILSLAECRFGPARKLFDGFPDREGFGHDVLPDGQWLMLENDDYTRPAPTLKVITNLLDELRRRMPANGRRP